MNNKTPDTDYKNIRQDSSLIYAIDNNDTAEAIALIRGGTNVNFASVMNGTPLHTATKRNNIEVAKLLIAYGANINGEDNYGETPLATAVVSNCIDMIEFLINNNANPNLFYYQGNTPLILAIERHRYDIADILIKSGANINLAIDNCMKPIHFTANDKNDAGLKFFVERGIDINSIGRFGNTVLHETILYDNIKLVPILINMGADINKANTLNNMTPLHIASNRENIVLMRKLIMYGADLYAKDKTGKTPLNILDNVNKIKYKKYKAKIVSLYTQIQSGRLIQEDKVQDVLTDYNFDI